jgi:hypothetical protein
VTIRAAAGGRATAPSQPKSAKLRLDLSGCW